MGGLFLSLVLLRSCSVSSCPGSFALPFLLQLLARIVLGFLSRARRRRLPCRQNDVMLH